MSTVISHISLAQKLDTDISLSSSSSSSSINDKININSNNSSSTEIEMKTTSAVASTMTIGTTTSDLSEFAPINTLDSWPSWPTLMISTMLTDPESNIVWRLTYRTPHITLSKQEERCSILVRSSIDNWSHIGQKCWRIEKIEPIQKMIPCEGTDIVPYRGNVFEQIRIMDKAVANFTTLNYKQWELYRQEEFLINLVEQAKKTRKEIVSLFKLNHGIPMPDCYLEKSLSVQMSTPLPEFLVTRPVGVSELEETSGAKEKNKDSSTINDDDDASSTTDISKAFPKLKLFIIHWADIPGWKCFQELVASDSEESITACINLTPMPQDIYNRRAPSYWIKPLEWHGPNACPIDS